MALSRSTGASNYLCVDEAWSTPNDDTDYVYTSSTTTVADKYNMQNHTSETGNINFVRIISRARTVTEGAPSGSEYKLCCYDGTTEEILGINTLTPTYEKYYETWATNPTGNAWTWSQIDLLRAGISCKTAARALYEDSLYLRPDGNGAYNETSLYGDTPAWKCVDEVTHDSDTTYIYDTSGRQAVTCGDHTTESGTINKVRAYAVCRWEHSGTPGTYWVKIGFRNVAGTWAWSGELYPGSSYTNIYYERSTIPGGGAWTWTEVDGMQIAVNLYTTDGTMRCTQMFAKVYHDVAAYTPPIRATQLYAIVNYTPSASVVTLPDPKNIDLSHSRNLVRKNLPSGNYIVYDGGRGSKTLTITGTETSAAYTDMDSLKTICHYGAKVTIAGLDDTNLNTDYWVSDISFSAGPGYPTNMYDYKLSLEAL